MIMGGALADSSIVSPAWVDSVPEGRIDDCNYLKAGMNISIYRI